MSRFAIALALVASLTTSAFATSFARPPTEAVISDVRTMPMRMLDRASVRAKLAEHRAANIARFHAYQTAGVFPSNTYQGRLLNVWVDDAGHYCAAATIIMASGASELVVRVGEQTNFIRLKDVKQGPLIDWMLTSGLTQEEIALIQRPFAFVGTPPVDDQLVQIAPDLRTRENARLARLYKQIDRTLAKQRNKSLELAVTRLMQHPDLAWQLLDGA